MTDEQQNQDPTGAGQPSGGWWGETGPGQAPPATPQTPPATPQSPLATPQTPPPTPPASQPAGAPLAPPTGQFSGPPMAPPPGVAPTVIGMGGPPSAQRQPTNKKPLLIVIGALVLVAALVAGGLVLFSGPETVAKRTYAKELCAAGADSAVDWIEAANDALDRNSDGDRVGDDVLKMIDELETHVKVVQGFNGDFQQAGSDGEALKAAIEKGSTKLLADLQDARTEIKKLIDDRDDYRDAANSTMDDIFDFNDAPGFNSIAMLPMVVNQRYNTSSRTEDAVADLDEAMTDESKCDDIEAARGN